MRNSRVSQNSDWVSWRPMRELWSHLELEKPSICLLPSSCTNSIERGGDLRVNSWGLQAGGPLAGVKMWLWSGSRCWSGFIPLSTDSAAGDNCASSTGSA